MNVAVALLSLVLCWLSLAGAKKAPQKAAEDAKMPRAIIHIGPPKTGSSSVQSMLHSAENRMEGENTYWPKGENDKKSAMHQFTTDLAQDKQLKSVNQMGHFFNESRALGRNVLLSSEFFAWMPAHTIPRLKDMLQGFHVTIVAVYREYLSHMISKLGEDNKMYYGAGHHKPFSKHLMGLDQIGRTRDYMTTLGDWQQVFGKDALQIVDYYGAIAAGKSVPKVVLCEVAGVLCRTKEEAQANVSDEKLLQQVLTYFYQFFAVQGTGQWQPCESDEENPKLIELFSKAFKNRPSELGIPKLRSNLSVLVAHSTMWDAQLREEFGDAFVYGDSMANLRQAQSIHVEDVDFDKLRKYRQWTKLMRGVFENAKNLKLLCDRDTK